MTATIHLVRHGAHDRLDHVLCGRMPGVRLGEAGLAQAGRLATRFAAERVTLVQASPLERARETAAPIAHALGLPVQVVHDLIEIDVGDWAGQTFEALNGDPDWALWNSQRALARAPGGEGMLDVQARAVSHVTRTALASPDAAIVMVSHSDVVKVVLAYFLGLPVDGYARFDIDPASVSTLVIGDWGARVLTMNDTSTAKLETAA